ncbi:MAG: hypothetical protein JSR46_01000 [Verrucomicrobia bacterium]|nr:hypothetical protein [Verrucomicrobiota bacterium]
MFRIALLFLAFSTSLSAISIDAKEYLEFALSTMEEGSVNRRYVDWAELRSRVYDKAGDAQTPADTYEAISLALELLGDNHSFFMTPGQVADLATSSGSNIDKIHSRLIGNNIGYISIPGCWTCDDEAMTQFAHKIQDAIQTLDQHDLNRWIIDLRENFGGTMAPMFVGLSSLLDTNVVGYFGDERVLTNCWIVEDGALKLGEYEWLNMKRAPYTIKNRSPYIAILLSGNTASSGEATAIAFLGQKNVYTFGQKTAGATSANELIELPDGACFLLATIYELDRLKRVYRSGITPDAEMADSEAALPAATEWLKLVSY